MASLLELEECLIESVMKLVNRRKFQQYESACHLLCTKESSAKTAELLMRKVKREKEPQMILLVISLLTASYTKDIYEEQKISHSIFLDTMKCFPRFIKETKEKIGRLTYDRFHWTWRQLSMQLFRLGTLEFEWTAVPIKIQPYLYGEQEKALSVHIPSDAVLTEEMLTESFTQAKVFFGENVTFYCHTWLLSPNLNTLLDTSSGIHCFYKQFQIVGTEDSNALCYNWLFQSPLSTKTELLPEDTSLRRSAKEYLLNGGCLGTGWGVIT